MSDESRRLFDAMIREDDDEKRAVIRREYVAEVRRWARAAVEQLRGRRHRPLAISTEPIPPQDLERAARYVRERGWVTDEGEAGRPQS